MVDPTVVTQFDLRVPRTVLVNKPVTVTVVAENGLDRPVKYTGPVTITSSDPGINGASITPTWNSNGVGTFQVTFTTANAAATLTVADNTGLTPPVSQTATINVVDPTVVTRFALRLPGKVAVNTPVPVTVAAENGFGQPVAGYAGPVTITSSDPGINGATITPTWNSNGVGTFQVTFTTANPTATLTVADNTGLTPPVSQTATINVVDPTIVTGFRVFLPRFAQLNQPTTVVVTAINGLAHPVTGYTGPVIVQSSSDATASISLVTSFATSGNGTAVYSVTFDTAGLQSLTVSDTNTPPTVTKTVWACVGSLGPWGRFGGPG